MLVATNIIYLVRLEELDDKATELQHGKLS